MTAPGPGSDAERLSRLLLESWRQGRLGDARIRLEALHDVMPGEPRVRFGRAGEPELVAGPEPEAGS